MFLPALDRSCPVPLFRQLVDRIVEGIESGALGPGDALPPTRRLAEWIGTSRFTVERAYDELWAQGYVESRSGSYTRVRRRPPRALAESGSASPSSDGRDAGVAGKSVGPAAAAAIRCRDRARQALSTLDSPPRAAPPESEPGLIDFSVFHPDPRLFPSDAFRRASAAALRSDPGASLSYGNPAGHPGLRERIARRMREHGAASGPENILITEGAIHALDLVSRLLADTDRCALCEDPTYPGALAVFAAGGYRARAVRDDKQGTDPLALKEALAEEGSSAAFLYTMPSFRNPTGRLVGQRRREELLAVCVEAGVPVLEDGFEEELGFLGNAIRPIASMDPGGAVLYVGTLSKSLFPGIRIGWIAASEDWIRPLTSLRAATGLGGNVLTQAAAAVFLDSGAYATHLRRVSRAFSRRLRVAKAAAARFLPASVRMAEPEGGYLLWLRMPGGPGREAAAVESEVLAACVPEGVAAAPGSPFYAGTSPGPALRLCIAGLDEEEIEKGMKRLGRVLAKVFRS